MNVRSLSVVVALGLSIGGCSLEAALNVDGDETTNGPGGGGPGGGGAADGGESSDTDATSGSEGETPPVFDPAAPSECNGRTLRVATFNIQGVGVVGSDGYRALRDILLRLDADVVCVQEVLEDESAALEALAAAAGYDTVIDANRSPAIGGKLSNACLGRVPLARIGSYGGEDLSSDPQANDVGRDILAVQADLTEPGDPAPCRVALLTVHLKSGFEPADRFRRQVEVLRLVQAVERYREKQLDDTIVVLGDFNETLDEPALGEVVSTLPAGLPQSFHLGSDITLPLTYDPFATLDSVGFVHSEPTQEDSTELDATWNNAVRLDYVWFDDADLVADEVYQSCRDNGVDDVPVGQWMDKAGAPLACGVSERASDHLPVLIELRLP